MIKLAKEQILLLHFELIKMTGGIDGIRDIALLESALESPFQSQLQTYLTNFESEVCMIFIW